MHNNNKVISYLPRMEKQFVCGSAEEKKWIDRKMWKKTKIVAVQTAKNICVYIIVNAENAVEGKRQRRREKKKM